MTAGRIRITHDRNGMTVYFDGQEIAKHERETGSWIPLKPGVQVTDGPAGIEVELQREGRPLNSWTQFWTQTLRN